MELVGIDVGGTFTDFVWLDQGRLRIHKEPTTPEDQSIAILSGLKHLGVTIGVEVVHGTTVATNALLERRGAKTALLTTKGFRDVLAIGRQNRPHLYKPGQQRPPHLVPASLRFELDERVAASGDVLRVVDVAEIRALADTLRRLEVDSLAIVLLFSFLHPDHEEAAVSVIREELPDVYLSVSSDLLPEYREYERTSTTVINAYVQPLVARYLNRLQDVLGERSVRMMQSSGGAISLQQAAEQAARLVLSGPAGGIVGAFSCARQSLETPEPLIVTFDMGGTSTDVALCPGLLPRTSESEISGLPLRFPSIDIHTVGAGGGSIARVDAGGVLHVGPESAGAVPGPACYDRGGTLPTVTDANLVLGRLLTRGLPGQQDTLILNRAHAEQALADVGKEMGLSVEDAALGVIRVANATMERALRKVSVEKGHNPRDYTLVPFGGAGPLHACALAEALDMRRILVPLYPGVLSAYGLTAADVLLERSSSVLQDAVLQDAVLQDKGAGSAFVEKLVGRFQALQKQVLADLTTQSTGAEPLIEAFLDMRYHGQSYELEIPLSLPVDEKALDACALAFHASHEQRYGYRVIERDVEFVTLRVRGRLPGTFIDMSDDIEESYDPGTALLNYTTVRFDRDSEIEIPCYSRMLMHPGFRVEGPCLVLQYDTTLVISGFWTGVIDRFNSINLWRIEDAPLVHNGL